MPDDEASMFGEVTEAKLRHALHLGLGRAIFYAQEQDLRPFRDVILDTCLHCYSYDTDVEGTRSDFMYELLQALPDKQFFFDEVLKSLKDCGDDADAVQRFHMAARLAFDGSEAAKQAVYNYYSPGPRRGVNIGLDFLTLDGLQGLLFVADKIGALLIAQPAEADSGWLLRKSIEICGEPATWDALREEAIGNPRIAAFLESLQERESHKSNWLRDIQSWTYAELWAHKSRNKAYVQHKWGETANDNELRLAAEGLVAAKTPKEQLFHLRIFGRRAFPLDPGLIIALTDIEEERVGWAAIKALANIEHPSVRAEAIRQVENNGRWRGEAIDLLARNFQPGDHRLALDWFLREEDKESIHAFGMDLRNLWDAHPEPVLERTMLESLYEKTPCSHCRGFTVDRLIKLGSLSDEMRRECGLDADEDVRELVNPTKAA